MRDLAELIDIEEPAWPLIQSWIAEATVPVEVLQADPEAGRVALHATQVTTRSPMGAIAYQAAGILIDNGWLRVLGAGKNPRFQRSLPEWNHGRTDRLYLVADDVLGWAFAINGGGLGEDLGKLYYFAPDSLRWEACEFSYSQFLVFAMSDNLAEFYDSLRWNDWRAEMTSLTGDQAMSILPFLWAEGPPIEERSRRAVGIAEHWGLGSVLKQQLH